MVRGRRSRALSDHRRRDDLEEGARRGTVDRGHRRRRRSPRSRHDVRGDLAAAAQRRRAGRRRAGERHPQEHRRRLDLAPPRTGTARGGDGQDRPGGFSSGSRRRLRGDRTQAPHRRRLAFGRPRRELGEAERHGFRSDGTALLPGTGRRPAPLRPDLPDGRADEGLRRRGHDLPAAPRETQTQRQPRPGLSRGRPGVPAGGDRRRVVREPGRGEDLALHPQSSGDPVLQGRPRRPGALLHGLRRVPGQLDPGRSLEDRHRQRDPERRLVRHGLRRRAPAGGRAGQSRHRLQPVAAGQPRPDRPDDRGDRLHPASAGAR